MIESDQDIRERAAAMVRRLSAASKDRTLTPAMNDLLKDAAQVVSRLNHCLGAVESALAVKGPTATWRKRQKQRLDAKRQRIASEREMLKPQALRSPHAERNHWSAL